MKFEEGYIDRKLVGSLAEQLFELLHFEIGCRVFRTGHEFLYPDLFNLANLKKRIYHERFGKKDIEAYSKFFEMGTAKEIVGDYRFTKSKVGTTLAKSPDFTIVTPSGNILQTEVKYRYDGELTEEEKEGYLKREAKPDLFVLMGIQPYIKILIPILNFSIEEYIRAFSSLENQLREKYKKEHPNLTEEKLNREFKLKYLSLEKINELMSEHFRDRYIYIELERKKDNSLRREVTGLASDDLVYSKEVLEKYGEIIKKWFHKG